MPLCAAKECRQQARHRSVYAAIPDIFAALPDGFRYAFQYTAGPARKDA